MSDTPPDSKKKGANLEARPDFDKKEVYDKEVKPLLDAFHQACLKHEIPMVSIVEVTRITKIDGGRVEIARDGLDLGSAGPDGYIPLEMMIARLVVRENTVFKRIKLFLEIAGII